MNATLPGTIPGLLRAGSPVSVVLTSRRRSIRYTDLGIVGFIGPNYCRIHFTESTTGGGLADVSLLLTDPTGRAHAAWWAQDRGVPDGVTVLEWAVVTDRATHGRPMSTTAIELLRDGCLALAGLPAATRYPPGTESGEAEDAGG